jgi:hypothetical protein
MAPRSKAKAELRGKARMRAEIVEISRGLNKIGAISDAELEKTTLKLRHVVKRSGIEPLR